MLNETFLCLKNGLERGRPFDAEFVSLEMIESLTVITGCTVWIEKSRFFLGHPFSNISQVQ